MLINTALKVFSFPPPPKKKNPEQLPIWKKKTIVRVNIKQYHEPHTSINPALHMKIVFVSKNNYALSRSFDHCTKLLVFFTPIIHPWMPCVLPCCYAVIRFFYVLNYSDKIFWTPADIQLFCCWDFYLKTFMQAYHDLIFFLLSFSFKIKCMKCLHVYVKGNALCFQLIWLLLFFCWMVILFFLGGGGKGGLRDPITYPKKCAQRIGITYSGQLQPPPPTTRPLFQYLI